MMELPPLARLGGRVATGLADVTHDPAALDSAGFWAVVADFEGRLTCARFRDVRPAARRPARAARWDGPAPGLLVWMPIGKNFCDMNPSARVEIA